MYLSDDQRRRYALWLALLSAVLSIAGGVWWMAVSSDEYRHLPEWRWRMWHDLPDVFRVVVAPTAGMRIFRPS